jgi:hypothetical protein
MQKNEKLFNLFYGKLLSETTKEQNERIVVNIAIVSFVIHLLLIASVDLGWLNMGDSYSLLKNPIAAIYTPFSFILVYEVYLLVFYLPKSITIYIGKQYEIITLIIVRRIFKDLSKLELTSDWFSLKNDLQFTYDILATVILFFLIYYFNKLNQNRLKFQLKTEIISDEVKKFIRIKNIIAMFLIPIFFILSLYSFTNWAYEKLFADAATVVGITDINKIFFDDFFTVLILVDVLLLLVSSLHLNKFNQVIRHSGFIISTILIKISFGVEGLMNTVLIVSAVLFGVVILAIHNKYEKIKTIDD